MSPADYCARLRAFSSHLVARETAWLGHEHPACCSVLEQDALPTLNEANALWLQGKRKRETPLRDKESIALLLIIISCPDVPMMNTWFNYHWRVFFLSALSQHWGSKSAGGLGGSFWMCPLPMLSGLVSPTEMMILKRILLHIAWWPNKYKSLNEQIK